MPKSGSLSLSWPFLTSRWRVSVRFLSHEVNHTENLSDLLASDELNHTQMLKSTGNRTLTRFRLVFETHSKGRFSEITDSCAPRFGAVIKAGYLAQE